jgi:hypothetical protein
LEMKPKRKKGKKKSASLNGHIRKSEQSSVHCYSQPYRQYVDSDFQKPLKKCTESPALFL